MENAKWKLANYLNQHLLKNQRMQITKLKEVMKDQVLNDVVANSLREQIVNIMADAFKQLPINGSVDHQWLGKQYDLFCETYALAPVGENSGGSDFNSSLWLWTLSRWIAPRQIIESGTHKGFSSWLFRQSVPEATIETFDIIDHNIQIRDESIRYHTTDWTDSSVECSHETDLIFFDCHVDHSKRIIEAYERGFRYLLLDDNFSLETFHTTGLPPAPTLSMIFDPRLEKIKTLRWLRNGKKKSLEVDHKQVEKARSMVSDYFVFPDLGSINRRGFQSELTFVLLKGF